MLAGTIVEARGVRGSQVVAGVDTVLARVGVGGEEPSAGSGNFEAAGERDPREVGGDGLIVWDSETEADFLDAVDLVLRVDFFLDAKDCDAGESSLDVEARGAFSTTFETAFIGAVEIFMAVESGFRTREDRERLPDAEVLEQSEEEDEEAEEEDTDEDSSGRVNGSSSERRARSNVARELSESNGAHFSLALALTLASEALREENRFCISGVRTQESVRRFQVGPLI